MKRILLFLGLNILMVLTLTVMYHVVCALLGMNANVWMTEAGLNLEVLAVWALVFGMGGAVISLLLSKPMAKWMTHATVITGTEGSDEAWLVRTVESLAQQANVQMPEVAIYPGEPNAFATGAFRNHALVAVSTGILQSMDREQLRAVLGHEMSHVANGDMVTLCLAQGVLNACVLFLSRALAFAAESAMNNRDDKRRGGGSVIYYLVSFVLQILLGLAASIVLCAYSRRREYAADAGSARLTGSPGSMISALKALDCLSTGKLPESLKAFGISGDGSSLFATHPPIAARIQALEKLTGVVA